MASNEACMIAFSDQLKAAINDEGQLYDIIKAANPDTPITGLGNPGKGIEYTGGEETDTGGEEETDVDRSQGSGGGGDGDDDSGFPVWAIVLIALAGLLILIAIISLYVRHKKRNRVEEFPGEQAQEDDMIDDKEPDLAPTAPMEEIKEEGESEEGAPAPEEEPAPDAAPEDDDESSDPSVWSDSADVSNVESSTMVDDDKEPALTAGSALAAMGAAGAAATMAKKSQKG